MKSRGGSEIMLEHLNKHVDTSKANILLIDCDFEKLSKKKPNIVWQQCSYDQPTVKNTGEWAFREKVQQFVYVSYWQYERFRVIFDTPQERSRVIKNAIIPVPVHEKPKGKIKLIYTSTPFRGLEILLDVLELLGRDDIETDIYSSTTIYGQTYHETFKDVYEPLFERARGMKGVNYKGYAPNDEVKKALQGAHIFAYPNIWEETSCIAAIEALSAGCKVVTTDNGVLPETCGDFASYVNYGKDHYELTQEYATLLNKEIDAFWSQKTQDELKRQVEHTNYYYSWERRAGEWKELLNSL